MFSLLYKNFFGDFQGMKAKKRSRPLRWDRSANIVPVVPPGLAQCARFNVLSYAAFCLRRALLRLAYSAKNLSPFRSPSKVHSVLLFPPQSHRLRLSWGKWVKLTHSFSSVLKNVSTYFFVCQLFFTNNFNFFVRTSAWRGCPGYTGNRCAYRGAVAWLRGKGTGAIFARSD